MTDYTSFESMNLSILFIYLFIENQKKKLSPVLSGFHGNRSHFCKDKELKRKIHVVFRGKTLL